MQALSDIRNDGELYSVDLAKNFVLNPSKLSGYLAEEAKKYISNVKQKFFLGDIAPNFIDEIGGDIDCLIIDTAHVLPGEFLDFLALFPYLKEDAIVILHDLCNNHCIKDRSHFRERANCTKLLFDSVTAEKYLMKDESAVQRQGFPNIGAFKLIPQTKEDLSYVAGALSSTWHYIPDEDQFSAYRKAIMKSLDAEGRWLFEAACKVNKDIFNAPTSLYMRIRGAVKMLLKGC